MHSGMRGLKFYGYQTVLAGWAVVDEINDRRVIVYVLGIEITRLFLGAFILNMPSVLCRDRLIEPKINNVLRNQNSTVDGRRFR